MKFLFDLIPVILFFVAYRLGLSHQEAAHALALQYMGGLVAGGNLTAEQAPIMLASAVGIVATVLQIGYLMVRGRKVDGGWEVTGRWPMSSGIDNSDWNMLGFLVRESESTPGAYTFCFKVDGECMYRIISSIKQ